MRGDVLHERRQLRKRNRHRRVSTDSVEGRAGPDAGRRDSLRDSARAHVPIASTNIHYHCTLHADAGPTSTLSSNDTPRDRESAVSSSALRASPSASASSNVSVAPTPRGTSPKTSSSGPFPSPPCLRLRLTSSRLLGGTAPAPTGTPAFTARLQSGRAAPGSTATTAQHAGDGCEQASTSRCVPGPDQYGKDACCTNGGRCIEYPLVWNGGAITFEGGLVLST